MIKVLKYQNFCILCFEICLILFNLYFNLTHKNSNFNIFKSRLLLRYQLCLFLINLYLNPIHKKECIDFLYETNYTLFISGMLKLCSFLEKANVSYLFHPLKFLIKMHYNGTNTIHAIFNENFIFFLNMYFKYWILSLKFGVLFLITFHNIFFLKEIQ